MPKDAYYFSHDSNAKDDPKCVLLIEQLGLEGYGIYWILIEVLRDQPEYRYPLILVPALARKYNTSAEKMRTVIDGYGLFIVDEKDFFSLSLIRRMEHLESKRIKASLAGKKSGEARLMNGRTPFEEKHDMPQVYVIGCFSDTEEFIKIGATSGTISRRFSGHMPYSYEVLRQLFTEDCSPLEGELQEVCSSFRYRPNIRFQGDIQCYHIDSINEIMQYEPINEYSHEHRFNVDLTSLEQVKKSKVNKSKAKENIYSSTFVEGEIALAESLPDNIESQTIEHLRNGYTGKGAQYKTGIGSNDTTSAEKSLENDRAQSTGRSEYSTEFEEFWSYYPRRVGKQAAYKAWTAQLKKKYKPEKLIAASRNYGEYCRQLGTDQKYMKHASTFLGPNSPFTEFVEGLPEEIGSAAKHKGGGMNGADKQDNGQPNDRFRETIGFNE